ncbi:hypothetical protein AXF42_Ash017964 [Apostasia shenzhenica]|uniref:Uncharacterized protein n=1 Tax=Apostasia shenzhenica TaxID=1088818 RepID=A0A2I0A509_9ASPA|nr:hypothetical protein AXF42_Ash017964 [Apostasia shenzhenica]
MITGGQNFVSSHPAFSNDAKKILVCTGNKVSIFSTSTGMLITELRGHSDLVTSVIVVPISGPVSKVMSYCWTSSMDGTICYWDFVLPEVIKKVMVQLPVISMVIPNISCYSIGNNEKESKLYAIVSVDNSSNLSDHPKALHGQVQLYNLTDSRRIGGLLAETQKPETIHVSKTGELFGIVNKRKLYIWRIPGKRFRSDEVKKIKLHHTKNLSTLAFHPTERIIAGGDITGRILIWRGVGKKKFVDSVRDKPKIVQEEERPGVRGNDDADSCTTWHWHANEVTFLLFSTDGAYLYSGGKEGAIVVWQLDTGKKRFKPRLGAPLMFFVDSPDPALSCISCADNQIHLLKMPTMEVMRSISGIKLPSIFPDPPECLNCKLSFDTTAGLVVLPGEDFCIQFFSLFDNMEVSQVQVCERNFQPVDDVMVFVALTALSQDSSIMGTVDVKLSEMGLGGLVTLKFWSTGSRVGEYSLSTVIYEPHRPIISYMDDNVGVLSGFSLLFHGHGRPHYDGVLHVVSAISITDNGSQFAVLAINNRHDNATKRAQDGIILLFDVENPVPLVTFLVRKAKGGGLAFLSPDISVGYTKPTEKESHSQLLAYISGDREFVVFDPLSSNLDQIAPKDRQNRVPQDVSAQTGYASVYGELPKFEMQKEKISETPFIPSERPWETIFCGSSHILPPLSKLCSTFFESLLEKRSAAE